MITLGRQGFAQTGHVAVAKNGEHAPAVRLDDRASVEVFHLHAQGGQVLDQRLRHRESLGFHIVCQSVQAAARWAV
ncbi:hypothetical protein D9M69_707240 [compost metagenome]